MLLTLTRECLFRLAKNWRCWEDFYIYNWISPQSISTRQHKSLQPLAIARANALLSSATKDKKSRSFNVDCNEISALLNVSRFLYILYYGHLNHILYHIRGTSSQEWPTLPCPFPGRWDNGHRESVQSLAVELFTHNLPNPNEPAPIEHLAVKR